MNVMEENELWKKFCRMGFCSFYFSAIVVLGCAGEHRTCGVGEGGKRPTGLRTRFRRCGAKELSGPVDDITSFT